MSLPTLPNRRARRRTGPAVAREQFPTRLVPVPDADVVVRPTGLETTYLEDGYDALGREQHRLHGARGETQSRMHRARADALRPYTERITRLIALDEPLVVNARDAYLAAEKALASLVLRRTRSPFEYRVTKCVLCVGDTAGTATGLVSYGELPILAVGIGVAAGMAGVTAGMAGEHLGRAAQASLRQQGDDLDEKLEPYRHLLDGRTSGRSWTFGLLLLAFVVVLLNFLGILVLRTSIEGSASGLLFAAISGCIALASFVNSWMHADVVADLLDAAERTYTSAVRRHERLALRMRLLVGLHAAEIADSITREHSQRGDAAGEHLSADKHRALMESPDVVGHGRPASMSSPKPPKSRGARR